MPLLVFRQIEDFVDATGMGKSGEILCVCESGRESVGVGVCVCERQREK